MRADEKPERLVERFAAAWNAGDAPALAALFAEDADFVNVVGLWWRRREDIERAHAYGFERIFSRSAMRMLDVHVRRLTDTAGVVHARWELRGQSAPDGSAGKPRRGVLMMVGVQDDAGWKAVAAQNTDRIPGTETWLREAHASRPVSYQSPPR